MLSFCRFSEDVVLSPPPVFAEAPWELQSHLLTWGPFCVAADLGAPGVAKPSPLLENLLYDCYPDSSLGVA